MIKINRLKAKMVEKGLKAPDVASKLGMNTSTFYRKLKLSGTFTVKEVSCLGSILGLSSEEMMDIFFSCVVA